MTKSNKEVKAENVLEQLELVEVALNDGTAEMIFLDTEAGEIREVKFNKRVWDADAKAFVKDAEKAEQVEEWSQKYFGTSFDDLGKAVGQKHDIYTYSTFNSLWESQQANKFKLDDVGLIFESEITSVTDDGSGYKIGIMYDEKEYKSNMGYTKQIAGKYYPEATKKQKQRDKFKEKYGVEIDDAIENGTIVGNKVMCEVRQFNENPFVEIKKPRWK